MACREAEGGRSFVLLIPERKRRRRMKMYPHNWTFMVAGGGDEDGFTSESNISKKKDKKIL